MTWQFVQPREKVISTTRHPLIFFNSYYSFPMGFHQLILLFVQTIIYMLNNFLSFPRLMNSVFLKVIIIHSSILWSKKFSYYIKHMGWFACVCLYIYRVSQEECARLREGVPYVKVYRYNPKHLCPMLNGLGDNGRRIVWSSCGFTHCTCQLTILSISDLECGVIWRQFSSC